jgi:protoporphyrinogen oxidase
MSEGTERATPLRVAVVGGGYAGLAAAERLVARGAVPTVFERSGRLGGLAMTLSVGGDEIEKYYHHWFTSDRDVLGLVHDLDLADRLRWISPVMGIFCRGEIHRFTSPIDLLRFKPFSWRAKLRFGAVTLFLQRYPRRQTFEGVSAASWLRRVAGREVYETVWGPLLRAKFGRRAADVSMAWIWSKMRLRGRSRTQDGTEEALGYLEGGFGVLTRRLAAEIERRGGIVRTTERVERISPRPGGGFDVRTPRGVGRFDAVISTVAPPILARLAPELPDDYRGRLEGIDHFAILCTLLVLRERISPIYWMNVSDPEVPFGGLIEHTNFVSPKRYGGRHLAYVSHYVDPEDEIWRLDLDRLLQRYQPGLRRIRPDLEPSWIEEAHPLRDRYAQPIVTTDYHRRLLPLASPLRGLYVATMAQVYPEDRGRNYAVRIGRAAAARLLDDHGGGALPPPELRATPVGRPPAGADQR